MSLSEKLEQARRQRMIAAGLLDGGSAKDPMQSETSAVPEPSTGGPTSEPIRIDSAPTRLAPVQRREPTESEAQQSVFCPSCKREGHVDMVDLVGQRTHMSCVRCGAMWQVHSATGVKKPG